MDTPSLTDYARLLYRLFHRFMQEKTQIEGAKRGRPYSYSEQGMIVFFMMMQLKRKYNFKAQHRWLSTHRVTCLMLGFKEVPHRTTLSRRYKALYPTLQEFMAFLAPYAADLDQGFCLRDLVEDKSLFKALGPVWHQSDRKQGRIPKKLRKLDQEATWGKSAYQGWVYGYGVHLTCTEAAFPVLMQVETGSVSETGVLDQKADQIIDRLGCQTLTTDNGYAKAMRIRRWAARGVALVTPALQWVKGRYAEAYQRFIKEPEQVQHLRRRRTSVEPLFDLMAKVLGTTGRHKQLPVQGLSNVRTCLTLAALTVEFAMVVNSIYGLALRNVSTIEAALS